MPELESEDPGPFLSLLKWMEGAGEVPLNIIGHILHQRGSLEGAGRKFIDTLSAIPDAVLPGNLIPEVSTPEDDVTASQAIGIDAKTHPGLAKAADIAVGTAVNPLSWLGVRGGALEAGVPFRKGVEIPGTRGLPSRAAQVISQGYSKLPQALRDVADPKIEAIKNMASKTGQGIRQTLNWLDVPPEEEAMIRAAGASGNTAARLAHDEVQRIYTGLEANEREAVGEIAHRIDRGMSTDRAKWKVLDDEDAYLANRTDLTPQSVDKIKEAVAARRALQKTLLDENPNVLRLSQEARDPDYIHRQLTGGYFDQENVPNALRKRTEALKDPKELLRFLKEEPEANLQFDALQADMARATQQGRMVTRGKLGEDLLKRRGVKLYDDASQAALKKYGPNAFVKEEAFELANAKHTAAVKDAIEELKQQPGQEDYAYKLDKMFNGMEPRSDDVFAKTLHTANRFFKGAATYGILVPRIAFNVRNRVSGLFQALTDPQARQTLPGNAKRLFSDLFQAADDGWIKATGNPKRRFGSSTLTKHLDVIDDAFKTSRGSPAALRKKLMEAPDGHLLVEALDNGVLNNFVDSEQLLSRMMKDPKWAKVHDFMHWPAAWTQGIEQRMRLGTFLDLRTGGEKAIAKSASDAAKTVRDTFVDYDVAGEKNRLFRDLVPFGSFLAGNTKQHAKFLLEQPSAYVAAANAFNDESDVPKYPWLDQQLSVPWGQDEKGQPQFLSGFGLPMEGLTGIPGLGRQDFYRDTVGALNPLLKTALSAIADKDSFTGRPFGENDKVFGESRGTAGRVFNILRGTGVPQPITGPFKMLEDALDTRKSITERALQGTTGLRFTSVDPDLATRMRIEAHLRQQPDVRSVETLYQTDKTPETQALLKQLREAKARMAEKRKAAAAL